MSPLSTRHSPDALTPTRRSRAKNDENGDFHRSTNFGGGKVGDPRRRGPKVDPTRCLPTACGRQRLRHWKNCVIFRVATAKVEITCLLVNKGSIMRGSRAARWKPRKAGRGAEQTVAVPFYYHPDAPTPAPSQHSRGARGSTEGACGNPGNGWDGVGGGWKDTSISIIWPTRAPGRTEFQRTSLQNSQAARASGSLRTYRCLGDCARLVVCNNERPPHRQTTWRSTDRYSTE